MLNILSKLSKSALYLNYFNLKDKVHSLHKKNQILDQYLPKVRKDGYIIIEDFYSIQQCTDLIEVIDQVLDEYKEQIWTDPEGADKRIWGGEDVRDEIRAYYENEFIRELTTQLYGQPTTHLTSMANLIHPTPGNKGSGHGWHRDSVHQRQIKSILYLNDVDETGGAFQYIVGTQRQGSIYTNIRRAKIDFAQNRFTEQDIATILQTSDYELRTLTAKAGSLIIADTFGIHRGKPIESNQRYAITNYSFPTSFLREKDIQRFETMKIASPK